MSAGDRLALGGRSVYAVVRGVNGGGLISVPSRSLPVLLPPPFRSFRYVSDFDENGVLYYLGTGGGTRPWSNPHDSGDVVCSWSSGRVCGGGPSDGTWVALRTHTGDVSLNGAGASASWSVEGARESYRCFRVIQTGVNSINQHYLMCSGVELYGDLMER